MQISNLVIYVEPSYQSLNPTNIFLSSKMTLTHMDTTYGFFLDLET